MNRRDRLGTGGGGGAGSAGGGGGGGGGLGSGGGRGRVPEEHIRAVLAAAPIHLIAGQDVKLVPADRGEYRCVCPFHDDHDPSCTVVPRADGGFFKCFPCGASGNAIEWVMKVRGLGFREALAAIEKTAGVTPWGTEPQRGQAAASTPPTSAASAKSDDEDQAPGDAPFEEASAEGVAPVAEGRHAAAPVEDAYAQRRRAESIAMAQHLWLSASPVALGQAPEHLDGSGPWHPRAVAYFEARGIRLADLPGGTLPSSLRYLGSCPRGARKDDERTIPPRVPAVIGLFVSPDNQPLGVQRIFLDETGKPAKLAGGEAKMTLGSTNAKRGGGAVRLCPVGEAGGDVYVAEGIETALAVLASLHASGTPYAAVWSVLGTSGLRNVEIPAAWREPGQNADGTPRGAITGAVIVADYDKSQAGQKAAAVCAARLADSGLRAWTVTPSHTLVPGLIDPQGKITQGKSVDWLDVVAELGAEAAGKAMLQHRVESVVKGGTEAAGVGASDAGRGGGGGGGGGGPGGWSGGGGDDDGEDASVLPADGRARAKMFLRQTLRPEAGGAWPLARAAGSWWMWRSVTDTQWGTRYKRWEDVSEERVNGLITAWAEHATVRTRDGQLKPAALGGDGIATLRRGLASIVDPCVDRMPHVLPAAVGPQGEPVYADPFRLMAGADEHDGREKRDAIAFADVLIDLQAWMEEARLEARPRTSRWFSRSCMPFAAPLGLIEQLGKSRDPDKLVAQAAPVWTRFLVDRFQNAENCIRELQKFCGYLLTSSVAHQRLLWLQGESGTGKGVIRDVVAMVVGDDNVCSTEFETLGGRFGLAPLIGKSVWFMSELRMDGAMGYATALDRLLKLSAGDPVDVEQKHTAAQTSVRMTGKFFLTPNEAPPIRDSAAALVRRLLVIPMLGEAVKEGQADRFLVAKMRAEVQGIVAWFLMGLRRLSEDGGFVQPKEGVWLREEMRAAQSPVREWFDDCCERDPAYDAGVQDMYESYVAWCGPKGVKPGPIFAFGRAIASAVPGLLAAQSRVDGKPGQRVRVYRGVHLVRRAAEMGGGPVVDGSAGDGLDF